MMKTDHLPAVGTSGNADHSLLASLWATTVAWVTTCADYYAASATYERLSGLSDAELNRRGLSRETLARDIVDAATRQDRH